MQGFWLRVRDEFNAPEGEREIQQWQQTGIDQMLFYRAFHIENKLCEGEKNNWSKQITSLLIRTMFLAEHTYREGKKEREKTEEME